MGKASAGRASITATSATASDTARLRKRRFRIPVACNRDLPSSSSPDAWTAAKDDPNTRLAGSRAGGDRKRHIDFRGVSHTPAARGGGRLPGLNPGSPTERRRAASGTIAGAPGGPGRVRFELVGLPWRPADREDGRPAQSKAPAAASPPMGSSYD